MPTVTMPMAGPDDDQEFFVPEAYPGENRDYWARVRMDKLNEQLKVVHKMKLPLCGECIEYHGKQLTCEEVDELMEIDMDILRNAIG
jgi:hypothetical protein